MNSKISIIMPVLNESVTLRHTLGQLHLSDDEELIIVDGGSTDETVSIAKEFTDNFFTAKTGRASVMNYGAQQCQGDILLFLHADCLLHENSFEIIRKTLADTNTAAGAFRLSINHPGKRFRIIEYGADARSRLSSLIYGDQGMFLRKDVFDRIGGFADIPLMEDIEISRRLKKAGRLVFLDSPIIASPRRWLQEGILYTTLRDWYIALLYSFFNVSPEKLITRYKDVR